MSSMRKSGSSQAEQDGLKPNKASLKEKDKGHALVNLWGIAGRNEIMETRRLWQLRILRPCK